MGGVMILGFGWMGPLLIVPVVLGGGIIFPITSTALIHHFLWEEETQDGNWFPRRASWWEAVWCYLASLAFLVLLLVILLVFVLIMATVSYLMAYFFGADAGLMGRNTAKMVKAFARSEQFEVLSAICWFYGAAMTFKLQRWSNRPKEKTPAEAGGNIK
jgi:glucan phosphoethanolaminetransferase (alkaline phosphatase superfamily)